MLQHKIVRHSKKQVTEAARERAQMLDLVFKPLKKGMAAVSFQIESTIKKMELVKQNRNKTKQNPKWKL